MKKAIAVILLVVFVLTIAGCSGNTKNNQTGEPTSIGSDETTLSPVGNSASYGEGFSSYETVINRLNLGFSVTTEDNIHLVVPASIYAGDPNAEEHLTDEVLSKKKANADGFIKNMGSEPTDEVELTDNGDCTFAYGDNAVYAYEYAVRVDCLCPTLSFDSTDEEIIEIIKNNDCLSALAKVANINPDNAVVYRETANGTDLNGNITYFWTDFAVFEKGENAGETAFNYNYKLIKFHLYREADDSQEDAVTSFFTYTYESKEVENEPIVVSFPEALDEAEKRQLERKNEAVENNMTNAGYYSTELVGCEIIYDVEMNATSATPCYRFWFGIQGNAVSNIDIPILQALSME